MITLEQHGDVTRVLMSSRASRAIGYSVSAYLTRDVIIDTGFPSVRHELCAVVERTRPRGAVVTHYHEDHGGNVGELARRGLPIAVADATLAALRAGRRIGLYRQVIWGPIEPLASAIEPFVPTGLELLHTPGHSADHHVVWDAERETLYSGDLFLGVKVRVAHTGEQPRQLAASVRAAAALRPRRMFDAHRGLVADPVSSLQAKADWLEETIAAIDKRIAEGWSDRAVTRDVLGREDMANYISKGGLSRINFVRGVRSSAPATAARPAASAAP
ncbi:MAG: MBL fold metallo-hydrolase [Gemmatimonadota bacterium]|nr:MBL fold metallo-hydrolase [Gemmatimonadota bacterium]